MTDQMTRLLAERQHAWDGETRSLVTVPLTRSRLPQPHPRRGEGGDTFFSTSPLGERVGVRGQRRSNSAWVMSPLLWGASEDPSPALRAPVSANLVE